MKRFAMIALATVAMGLPALTGCEKKVAESEHSEQKSDGTVVDKKETVTKDMNGNINVEKSKTESTTQAMDK